jgi:photosystem II stability/assembly factor-like uncharacterized protein
MTAATHSPSLVNRLALLLASMLVALLAGCGGSDKGSSADPPANFRVAPGDGSVIVSWTQEPETEYWIFFGVGPNINTSNWIQLGGVALPNAVSPRIITGLSNGTTYSFTINARKNKGPGGPGAPTQVVVPVQAGETWSPGPALGTQNLNAMTAGNMVNGFDSVIVGDAGVIYSSIAAAPMAARTNPVPNVNLYSVVYGGGIMVAGGEGGTLIRSTDTIAWTTVTSGTTARLNAGSFSASGTFILVGAGGGLVASTDGGTSWTTPGSGVTTDLYGATFGTNPNRFVVVGAEGVILVGESGADWVRFGSGLTDRSLRAAAFGSFLLPNQTTVTNRFVAVGDGGTVLTSTDANTWTVVPAFTTKNLRGVIFGGRFVAVGEDGAIFTSSDGLTWETRSSGTTADLNAVAREVAGYTAVGEAGTNVSTFQ